ncbi:cytochrome C oxidase biogenesis Cmc1-like protein [Rhizoctonia solani AG-3 Rhs1AP]|uniref:COX assembly mitochondrial protein n=1 Tax=Rhizoctonia solani AG-3 Rhs1AP TaxID=1086054 RepID=X8J731_9AGAM|nr:cytochrome C oxidase biogenesis Cmc1-like protein [Rhizoctonia solani AG-3 Rhs1AP]
MHPHLATPERQNACGQLIEALEACHASGFINKYMGGCNSVKEQLNTCLRAERVARTDKNREDAKKRNQMTKKAWSELE